MSPWGLVQERVARDRLYPWRVLVLCALLNRTGRAQVRPMFEELFRRFPGPAELAAADGRRLAPLLRPLGLWRRRADLLRRLSADYVEGLPPERIHGVGRYALDAHAIFVEGRTDVETSDHFLARYIAWRRK